MTHDANSSLQTKYVPLWLSVVTRSICDDDDAELLVIIRRAEEEAGEASSAPPVVPFAFQVLRAVGDGCVVDVTCRINLSDVTAFSCRSTVRTAF